MMKLLMAFLHSWRDFFRMSIVYQRNGVLTGKENVVVQLTTYIQVNAN